MVDIHNRMLVILQSDAGRVWLDPEVQDAGLLTTLLVQYPSQLMAAYPVSTLVNSPRNESPECVQPIR